MPRPYRLIVGLIEARFISVHAFSASSCLLPYVETIKTKNLALAWDLHRGS